MKYEILNDNGEVINTIVADEAFIQSQYAGKYRLIDSSSTEPYVDPKLKGIEINGTMCSATRDDQNGLSAVAIGVTMARSAGRTFPATQFKFENGNSLVIDNDNFDMVYETWVTFRQSFFVPE